MMVCGSMLFQGRASRNWRFVTESMMTWAWLKDIKNCGLGSWVIQLSTTIPKNLILRTEQLFGWTWSRPGPELSAHQNSALGAWSHHGASLAEAELTRRVDWLTDIQMLIIYHRLHRLAWYIKIINNSWICYLINLAFQESRVNQPWISFQIIEAVRETRFLQCTWTDWLFILGVFWILSDKSDWESGIDWLRFWHLSCNCVRSVWAQNYSIQLMKSIKIQ